MTDTATDPATPPFPLVPLDPELVAKLFAGGGANVTVEAALDGLSAEDAVRVPDGLPHSVAQLLAHMAFWQGFVLEAARGGRPAWPQHAADGWPDVDADGYEALKQRFLADLAEVQALARDPGFLAKLAGSRAPQPWLHQLLGFASHTVYHLGQIVLTRRALGAWPPPNGGDTW